MSLAKGSSVTTFHRYSLCPNQLDQAADYAIIESDHLEPQEAQTQTSTFFFFT